MYKPLLQTILLGQRRWICCLFSLTTFVSAFLLFQIQPIIGKAVLPWFGGVPAVWTTALLFFQVLLCLGYAYAHFLTDRFTPSVQAVVHMLLVLAAVIALPVLPPLNWNPAVSVTPTWNVLWLLLIQVGLPFFLLSTTAPLVQVWWSKIGAAYPYRLYALSNTGSLLALVTYPFVFIPLIGIRAQALVWTVAFTVLAVLLLACGSVVWFARQKCSSQSATRSLSLKTSGHAERPAWRARIAWLMLPTIGSCLLLAITNYLCQDMAVVPLLWVAPLGLYLFSFIVCFGHNAWYRRSVVIVFALITTGISAVFYRYTQFEVGQSFSLQLAVQLATLLAGCMFCHGELARLRPAAAHLTSFYLHVSVGGALGGVLICLIAPLIFTDYYEFPLTLIALWLVMFATVFHDYNLRLHKLKYVCVFVAVVISLVGFVSLLSDGIVFRFNDTMFTSRNFYGTLKIKAETQHVAGGNIVSMYHGITRHGAQFVDDDKQNWPTTYYTPSSGIGQAMAQCQRRDSSRIGVVGLGVGTLAAYGQPGMHMRFYEVNPDVIYFAKEVFRFLDHLQSVGGSYEIVRGDARISLEDEIAQDFDLLVIDAFSGDAIPVHLLTQEAFAVYLRHLKPTGMLALHISNRNLDLLPVIRGSAAKHGLQTVAILQRDQILETCADPTLWVMVGNLETTAKFRGHPSVFPTQPDDRIIDWTDDYSNLLGLLK